MLALVVAAGWLVILQRDRRIDIRRLFSGSDAASDASTDTAEAGAPPAPPSDQEALAPDPIAHEIDASTLVVVDDNAPPARPSAAPAGAFSFGNAAYTEPDCETLADLSAARASHKPGQTRQTAMAITKARYPSGTPFIQAQEDRLLLAWFTGAPDTFDGVASRIETAVHEGSHVWGAKRFNGRTSTYSVRSDLSIETRLLKTFHRSEIVSHHVDPKSDSYVHVYLEGSSGAQGFDTLLDEYNAYTHTLAAGYCTRDLLQPNIRMSTRDGILTMMYYVETYLAIARQSHTTDYAAILADPQHRKLILTVWDRAEFWLRKSAPIRSLGIRDEQITQWVYDADRLAEIARVRDAH